MQVSHYINVDDFNYTVLIPVPGTIMKDIFYMI